MVGVGAAVGSAGCEFSVGAGGGNVGCAAALPDGD